jgi:hypothetical protein
MSSKLFSNFFDWYEKHLKLNTAIASGLFLLQLIHLYWLFTDVILFKLTGHSYFPINHFWQYVLILVDYTEIPALISTTILYINEYRKTKTFKSFLFIFLLNSQWLHLFWITDEFVVESFNTTHQMILPAWLAWIAILIDYLEVPVIIDTTKKFVESLIKDRRIEFPKD